MADRLDQNDPVDKVILDRMNAFQTDGSGYPAIQNTRPQTIGYGLVDSPLLQPAWIAEKVHEWTDLPVDRDQLLTTVSLYWFYRLRRHRRAHPLRAGAFLRLGRATGRAAGSRSSARTRRCANWYPPGRRALDRVPARQALPGDGGPCPAGRGPADVLRAAAATASGPSTSSGTTAPLAVGPLPMVAVHDVVERAPVGPLIGASGRVAGVPRVISTAQNRSGKPSRRS